MRYFLPFNSLCSLHGNCVFGAWAEVEIRPRRPEITPRALAMISIDKWTKIAIPISNISRAFAQFSVWACSTLGLYLNQK